MSDEKRRILNLLAQGKISVDEAELLLGAIEGSDEKSGPAEGSSQQGRSENGTAGGGPPGARYLRVEVHKAGNQWHAEKQVTIRIPVSIVRGGMRLGAVMHGFGGDEITEQLRKRGIDLSKLDPEQLDSILKDLGELTVDVDQGKAQVRITCE